MAKKECFVISPIGNPGSSTRAHADQVLKYIIGPAVRKAGYNEPIRADYEPDPSIITNTIIKHLFEDDLVVAILSGKNPNVFYELAIRHAIMKPCVHLIDDESWPPPFDLVSMNMIRYNLTDWSSPEKAIEELCAAIKIAQTSGTITNPVSMALAVQKSIISTDTDVKSSAILAEQVQGLTSEVRRLQSFVQGQGLISGVSLSPSHINFTPIQLKRPGFGSIFDEFPPSPSTVSINSDEVYTPVVLKNSEDDKENK